MLIGFIIAFFSTVGFAFLNEYSTLLVARCMQGIGSSLMTIAGELSVASFTRVTFFVLGVKYVLERWCMLLKLVGLAMLSSLFSDEKERGRAMGIAFSGLAFGLISKN